MIKLPLLNLFNYYFIIIYSEFRIELYFKLYFEDYTSSFCINTQSFAYFIAKY